LLVLFNSLTQKAESFEPREGKTVKMYTCGPSTYQRPHIGNYRTFLFEDILQRYLEYIGYDVIRLITLTNIEDKALAQATKEGLSVEELTTHNEAIFFKDFELLYIKRPNYVVRASTIADQAAKLIRDLMDKGIAYKYTFEGAENIYYDPLKFPGFGRLAHLNMTDWPKKKRRFHKDTYPGMPWNRGDFILWHGCKGDETVCWDNSVGRGRPAWNIQDAAMVTKHLGFSVDLACGGIDNLVRHHDYVLAVAEAVSGKPFAAYWLHGGHLYIDGKKMSKSKGNVLYPDNLLGKGYTNAHIRFFLIYGAYREKRDFTWSTFAAISRRLDQIKTMVNDLQKVTFGNSSPETKHLTGSISSVFEDNMNNNLDVAGTFDAIYDLVKRLCGLADKEKLSVEDANAALSSLKRIDSVLQVIF
jgi:cysteinyl-tRNA synthetase